MVVILVVHGTTRSRALQRGNAWWTLQRPVPEDRVLRSRCRERNTGKLLGKRRDTQRSKGRWSVPECVPTLERGNESMSRGIRQLERGNESSHSAAGAPRFCPASDSPGLHDSALRRTLLARFYPGPPNYCPAAETTTAFSMTIVSTGTSWCPALFPVFWFSMASTASMPSTTLPNTQ